MPTAERRHLYLPARDRSFWRADAALPLRYLAWGARDFHRQPIPASRHEGWVCVLIEEGAPLMVVGRHAVRMPPGTLSLIGPDCLFGWRGSPSGASKFRLWMWASLDPVSSAGRLQAGWVSRALARHERPAFLQLHDLCRREVLRPDGPEASYLEGTRLLFATAVQRALIDVPANGTHGQPDLVALARQWLESHLDSREPVARVCDYLNVSQSTLYRVFRAAEGLSPHAWFHRARLARAHALLGDGRLSVKEVAHALGYEHANDFSRAYRRQYARVPSARA